MALPTLAAAPRKRRPRTSVKQLAILQEAYTLEPMPCSAYREMLSDLVGLSNRSIQIWFQNRRQKLKQPENHETSEMLSSKKDTVLAILSASFSNSCNPSLDELDRLSQEIGISPKSISVWFQTRIKATRAMVDAQMKIGSSFKPRSVVVEGASMKPKKTVPAKSPFGASTTSNSSFDDEAVHAVMKDENSDLDTLNPVQQNQHQLFMNHRFLLQDSSLPHFTTTQPDAMYVSTANATTDKQMMSLSISTDTNRIDHAFEYVQSPYSASSPDYSPIMNQDPTLFPQHLDSSYATQAPYPSIEISFEPSSEWRQPSPAPVLQEAGCHSNIWSLFSQKNFFSTPLPNLMTLEINSNQKLNDEWLIL
jgi:hypothetical protein